ncbi:MAG: beta-hydroxyacyl-ACP dehydratase [Candidatus Cryptobacteroides sp.]
MKESIPVRGDAMSRLLPQKPPMMMVDTLYSAGSDFAETGLTVYGDNVFCMDGYLIEPGIIEHSAQSAAAFSGYRYFEAGEEPRIGLIGEIKTFRIERLPKVGESIRTRVRILGEAFGMSLVGTESFIDGVRIAGGQIKIFIKED